MRRGQYLAFGAGAVALIAAAITVMSAATTSSKGNAKQGTADALAACNALGTYGTAANPNIDEILFTVQSDAAAAAAKDPRWQVLANDAENYRRQLEAGSNVLGADGGKAWARLLSDCQAILGPNN